MREVVDDGFGVAFLQVSLQPLSIPFCQFYGIHDTASRIFDTGSSFSRQPLLAVAPTHVVKTQYRQRDRLCIPI